MDFTIKHKKSLREVKLKDLLTFSKLDKTNEQLIMYKAFELFTNIKKQHVNLIPYNVAKATIELITKTLETKCEDRRVIDIDGTLYGRIPNLDTISFGEYIELDTFVTPLAGGEINKEDIFKFMSCLYRPITEMTNDIYKIVDFTNEYLDSEHWRKFQNHCPADVFANSVGFFLNLRIELLKATRGYFLRQKLEGQENNLRKIGDGMEVLKRMQQVNLSLLTKQANTLLQLPSIRYPMMQMQED